MNISVKYLDININSNFIKKNCVLNTLVLTILSKYDNVYNIDKIIYIYGKQRFNFNSSRIRAK